MNDAMPAAGDRLPVHELRAHLRLGTGFPDDTLQDEVLIQALQGAIAHVEGTTGKAVLTRDVVVERSAWRDLARAVLPYAPAREITAFAIVSRSGVRTEIAPGAYHLDRDPHRPALVARSLVLPTIPIGGHAFIAYRAGYAETWAGLPGDLASAILALAAALYEDRTMSGGLPRGAAAILARYRMPRLTGGLR